jgi:pilus assembly protein CpaB
MRASAVRVNEVVGVAGFVLPGSHVDVLASGQQVSADSAATGPVTRTVLQNITVLSVGQDFKKDGDGKPVAAQVVNLLVSPQQAEVLSLAGNQTTIQLILRNALDTALVDTPGAAMNGLFGGMIATAAPRKVQTRVTQEPARPPAVLSILPAHIPDMVEVIQGTKRMEVGLMQPGVTQGASK